MRWGLIPSWWEKTAKEVPSTFNARAETVATKPMFRAAFKRCRCLIPASGYFEWRPTPPLRLSSRLTVEAERPNDLAIDRAD